MKANEIVRHAAKSAGQPLWKVADSLGVCEQTLIRWLHKPLDRKKENEILQVIAELAKEES